MDTHVLEGLPRGEHVARLLQEALPGHGFPVRDVGREDWGWRVELVPEPFELWIGCGHYQEYPDGHLCFIAPSKPYVRRWLKRISTASTVERLAAALERVVQFGGKAENLRWWTEAEVARA